MQTNINVLRNTKINTQNKTFKNISKYFLVFFSFLIASCASINFGTITPFAFAIFYALIMFNFNVYITGLLYILAYSLMNLSLTALYSAINVVLVGIIIVEIYKRAKKNINRWLMLIYALIGNTAYIYFNLSTLSGAISISVSVVLGLLFLLCTIHFLQSTMGRNFNLKLNLDEVISGSIVLIVFSMGFAAINIYGFEFIKVFAVLCILCSAYLLSDFSALFVASVIGIGAAIYSNNINYISVFVAFALIAKAFKSNNKIFSCLAIILCEIMFGMYFLAYETFTIYSVLSVIIAELIFLVMPSNILAKLNDILGGIKNKVAIRNIINHSKEGICNRMLELSNVFNEMDNVFRTMVKGVLPAGEAKNMLVSETIDKITKACTEMNKAYRTDTKSTTEVFSTIIDTGLERGKITLLDIPQFVTGRCTKVNYLINTVNQLLASYKHYAVMVNNMDCSKILIAEQLSGISNILKNLSDEVKTNISFDLSKENRIIEELSYKNIHCTEAIVYEQNPFINNTTLILKEAAFKPEIVERVVSKIVSGNMKIAGVSPSAEAGCVVVNLKTRPNFDIVFGSASAGKSGVMVSGDTHSLIKIDEGKFMVALCDGMGSGKEANLTSSLAISLIENFYKAGFDNEIILNSVNKLLALNNDEIFTTVDICVLDTKKGTADFIKHKSNIEVVETCGLPIGVLEEMKPHITKKILNNFDIIVLVSDGITQAFEEQENLDNFINNLDTTNPQTAADEILDRAVDLNNGICNDDMTVVAVRVFAIS